MKYDSVAEIAKNGIFQKELCEIIVHPEELKVQS